MDIINYLASASLEELSRNYDEAKQKIDDLELFQKWKDAIDKAAETGFNVSERTALALLLYAGYKLKGGK